MPGRPTGPTAVALGRLQSGKMEKGRAVALDEYGLVADGGGGPILRVRNIYGKREGAEERRWQSV